MVYPHARVITRHDWTSDLCSIDGEVAPTAVKAAVLGDELSPGPDH
ncbi:hypothetical protein [Sinorhizobium fredii]|nr:hypothetical protein [Sinorhizobium fredii]